VFCRPWRRLWLQEEMHHGGEGLIKSWASLRQSPGLQSLERLTAARSQHEDRSSVAVLQRWCQALQLPLRPQNCQSQISAYHQLHYQGAQG